MKNNENKLTRFRLEASVQDVTENGKEYLANELKHVLESNKPYQTKADYIGYSILSIDEKISLLDEEINSLKAYKSKLKVAKGIALQTGAKVFQEYGITKIEGAGLSSVSVTAGTETTKLELQVLDEKAFIEGGFYKKVVDEKKILETYVQGEYKEFIEENAIVTKAIYIKPSVLRVNKRRGVNNQGFSSDISDVGWKILVGNTRRDD